MTDKLLKLLLLKKVATVFRGIQPPPLWELVANSGACTFSSQF